MFINLYKDVMINYENNTHLIFDREDNFIRYLAQQSKLVEEITSTDAMNYLPNTNEFLIKLTNMANASKVNYIIWYTNNSYKHFRVVSYKEYSNYVVYSCESDLWADSTYNSYFTSSKIKLNRSNMTYIENEGEQDQRVVPYYYDSINYTNKEDIFKNFTTTAVGGNINNNTKCYAVAFDRQVDSWSTQALFFGSSWESVIALFPSAYLNEISRLISDGNGNKIRVKAIYVLPFTPGTQSNIEVHYQNQPTDTHLYVSPIVPAIYYTTKILNDFDNGNNKVYVGAGDSMMLVEPIAPSCNIDYRFIFDKYSMTAYVGQGDNTKDITDAYVLKITSNDATLSLQESLAKITGAGFKAVSGALMLGSPATAVGGLTSIAGAGLDLLPSSKPASYTLDGNAVSTYITKNGVLSNGFNYKVYKSINNMNDIIALYGVNYNYYTSLSFAIRGTLIEAFSRQYIKAEVLKLNSMNVEQYKFVKAELERGIYITEPIVPITPNTTE